MASLCLISHYTLQICEGGGKLPEIKFQMMFLSYDIIQLHLTCWVLCFWVLLILIHFKGLWVNGGANRDRSVSVSGSAGGTGTVCFFF